MFNQIIVVEGTHDEAKIKEVYKDAFCIITNGSEISDSTLKMIEEYAKTNEIIIFTDPDSPGERIRNKVMQVVPSAKHAFIKKNKCISNNHRKVGVEHASKEDIKASLESFLTPVERTNSITIDMLTDLGLVGSDNSSYLRGKISDELNIGKPNAKTFLKRINLFGITYDKLKEMVEKNLE